MLKTIFVPWFSSHIQGYNEEIILSEQMSFKITFNPLGFNPALVAINGRTPAEHE